MDTITERLKNLRERELATEIFAILNRGEFGAKVVVTELIKHGFSVVAAKTLVQNFQDDIRITRFREKVINTPNPWVLGARYILVFGGLSLLGALLSKRSMENLRDYFIAFEALGRILTSPSAWLRDFGANEFTVDYCWIWHGLLAYMLSYQFRHKIALYRYKRYLHDSQNVEESAE